MKELTNKSYDINALRPESSLKLAKNIITGISDPEERAIAELMFCLGSRSSTRNKKHIVILVHGIRTHAVWQERLAATLVAAADVEVYPIGYGFFDVLRFWCPLFTRREPIKRVLRELRTARKNNPDADISVVAHSFGTYIISEILSEETDIILHRLQLCGSIINFNYRWDKVTSRVTGAVVNDAGTQDCWPVLASVVTWGYGPSGTFGFKTVSVRDRYHNCGHSDFFTDTHMKEYWVPLIIDGQVKESPWTVSRPSPSALISFIGNFPFKTTLAILIALQFVRLYIS